MLLVLFCSGGVWAGVGLCELRCVSGAGGVSVVVGEWVGEWGWRCGRGCGGVGVGVGVGV